MRGGLSSDPRGGWSLVEVWVAVSIGLLVATLAGRLLAHTKSAVTEVGARVGWLSTVRMARWSLGQDARFASAVLVDEDSVRLRSLRGWAVVCRVESDSIWIVGHRGLRAPNPLKDSVRVLDRSGAWSTRVLSRADRVAPDWGECALATALSATTTFRLIVSGGQELSSRPLMLRVFESGGYHLDGGVLRYRAGSGPRQPLTVPGLLQKGRFEVADRSLMLLGRDGLGARLSLGG